MGSGHRYLLGVVLVGLAATASAAAARETARPGFAAWGDELGLGAYHHVAVTCEEIEHAFGRNAAWGLWRLPLARVVGEADGPDVTFRCREGADCIGSGRLTETPDRIGSHRLSFDSPAAAAAFSARIKALQAACPTAS